MRIVKIAKLTLIGIFAICSLMAEEQNGSERTAALPLIVKDGNAQRPSKTMKLKREDVSNITSLSNFEIFTGLTIQPGQTLNLFGILDWTGADTASIAIACPTSTSLQNTQVLVYWQMPAFTNTYTATSGLLGSNLLFTNMGGGVVPVFGNFFGLQVKNTGSAVVACDQLTVYGVVR